MDRQTDLERVEEMKRALEAARERGRYDLDAPVEPVDNKSGVGRALLSVIVAAILIGGCALLISWLALQNAGQPLAIDLFGLF